MANNKSTKKASRGIQVRPNTSQGGKPHGHKPHNPPYYDPDSQHHDALADWLPTFAGSPSLRATSVRALRFGTCRFISLIQSLVEQVKGRQFGMVKPPPFVLHGLAP
jgi:hypothetical protein